MSTRQGAGPTRSATGLSDRFGPAQLAVADQAVQAVGVERELLGGAGPVPPRSPHARQAEALLVLAAWESEIVRPGTAGEAGAVAVTVSGRSAGRIRSSLPRTTARSTALDSSRTLAGQE